MGGYFGGGGEGLGGGGEGLGGGGEGEDGGGGGTVGKMQVDMLGEAQTGQLSFGYD